MSMTQQSGRARAWSLLLQSLRVDLHDAWWHLLVNRLIGSPLTPRAVRLVALRVLGMRLGAMAQIFPGCDFKTARLTLGDGAMVNSGCSFDNGEPVVLGRRVRVGQQVMFLTTTHEVGGPEMRAGDLRSEGIVVGDGVWIGARTVLLPGSVVGDGCVAAAGSVVRGRLEPDHLYAGVPARPVKALPPGAPRPGVAEISGKVRAVSWAGLEPVPGERNQL